MATWRDVRKLALSLPGVIEESTAREKPAWLVNKKFFAWERPLRPSDIAALGDKAPTGPILGVRTTDLEMKEVLLASAPGIYFTTPHFNGYPAVLVRLQKIGIKELKKLLEEAWLGRAPKRAVTAYLQRNSTPPPRPRATKRTAKGRPKS